MPEIFSRTATVMGVLGRSRSGGGVFNESEAVHYRLDVDLGTAIVRPQPVLLAHHAHESDDISSCHRVGVLVGFVSDLRRR